MKNIVITGANRGIGLALTHKYLDNGDNVFALCRKSSKELSSTNAIIIENIDIRSMESIETSLIYFDDIKIDILINNAGQWVNDNKDYDKLIDNYNINSIGAMRVVDSLKNRLNFKSKIIFVTSKMGSIEDNSSGGRYGYRMSKAALNAYGKSLSQDLLPLGISVGLIHPGWVKTDMGGSNALISAELSASEIMLTIDKIDLTNTGSFFNYDGKKIPW